jgi:hypothetical protein
MPGSKGRRRTPSGSMSSVPSDSEKMCTACQLVLPISEFYKQPTVQADVRARCRPCMREERRELYHRLRRREEEEEEEEDEESPAKRARVESDLYIMAMSLDPEGHVHGLKVGRSANIPQRGASLAAGLPFTMIVLATFTGAGAREEAVHTALAPLRNTNGKGREWFHASLSAVVHAVACALQSRTKVNGGPAPTAEQ